MEELFVRAAVLRKPGGVRQTVGFSHDKLHTCWPFKSIFSETHTPIHVPRDHVAIEARRDEETSVGVVFDVLHPAGVTLQGAHL